MNRDYPRRPEGQERRVAHHERRQREDGDPDEVTVRLTRKYAAMIDGISLENASVGDHLALSAREAGVLIAEGWAERSEDRRVRMEPRRAMAADSSHRSKTTKK
jgi:hypothetical protein